MYAALGIHPHDADTDDARRLDELRELLAHDRAVAVGETGLDHYRDYAPRAAQLRLFEEQLALAADVGLPVVDPLACGGGGHERGAQRLRRRRRAPLLLRTGAARRRAGAWLLRLVRRQRHVSEGGGASRRSTAGAGRSAARRDRLPIPRATSRCVGARTSRRTSSTRSTRSPTLGSTSRDELVQAVDANADRLFGLS